MRSTASERRSLARLLGLMLILATPMLAQTQAPAPAGEILVLEQPAKLYEGKSTVFKVVAELKAGARVQLLKKERSWAKMKDVASGAEGFGLLPVPKRVQDRPRDDPFGALAKTPSPTLVGLVTKGLADSLRHKAGGDHDAVKRMQAVTFTPEQLEQFMALLMGN